MSESHLCYQVWVFGGRKREYARPKVLTFTKERSVRKCLYQIAKRFDGKNFKQLDKSLRRDLVDWMLEVKFIAFDEQFQSCVEIKTVELDRFDFEDLCFPHIESKYQMEDNWPTEKLSKIEFSWSAKMSIALSM